MKFLSAWKQLGVLLLSLASVAAQAAPNAFVVNVLDSPSTITVFDTETNLVVGDPIVIPADSSLDPPPATTGSGPQDIVINQAGTRAYIADIRANQIEVLDLSTATPTFAPTPISLAAGGPGGGSPTMGPIKLAFRPGFPNQLFVVQLSGHVVVVDTDANAGAGAVIAGSSLPLGSGSQSIVFNQDGSRAYIPNRGDGTVSVIDATTVPPAPVQTIASSPRPVDVVFDSVRNRLLVANSTNQGETPTIRVFDTSGAMATEVPMLSPILTTFRPGSILLNPANTRFYAVEDFGTRVFAFDAATLSSTPVDMLAVGTAPEYMEFSTDGSRLYVPNALSDNVSVFDTSDTPAVPVTTIATGNNPKYLAIAPAAAGAPATLQFNPTTATVTEGPGTSVTLTVTRTGDASGSASATATPTNGSGANGAVAPGDFTADPIPVNFGPGVSSVMILVPITNDDTPEQTETFTVVLSGATGATLGADDTATITISDDDSAPPAPPPPADDGGGGGGCTLNAAGAADYGLPLLLLLAGTFYALRRRFGV